MQQNEKVQRFTNETKEKFKSISGTVWSFMVDSCSGRGTEMSRQHEVVTMCERQEAVLVPADGANHSGMWSAKNI